MKKLILIALLAVAAGCKKDDNLKKITVEVETNVPAGTKLNLFYGEIYETGQSIDFTTPTLTKNFLTKQGKTMFIAVSHVTSKYNLTLKVTQEGYDPIVKSGDGGKSINYTVR